MIYLEEKGLFHSYYLWESKRNLNLFKDEVLNPAVQEADKEVLDIIENEG